MKHLVIFFYGLAVIATIFGAVFLFSYLHENFPKILEITFFVIFGIFVTYVIGIGAKNIKDNL